MKRTLYTLLYCLGFSLAVLGTVQRLEATLGEFADSVESDRKVLSAVRGSMNIHTNYTVHEFNANSTAVREYVSPAGIVFGVAWKGLNHPDLSQLLGSYAGEYLEALKKTSRQQGRRSLEVKTNRIVVKKWGHMRNLQGQAYAPDLIPPGVSVNDIR